MAQTKAGAQKAKATILEKYGSDYYVNMGRVGGKIGTDGGYHYAKRHYEEGDIRHPRGSGKLGGMLSRKGKSLIKVSNGILTYRDLATGKEIDYTFNGERYIRVDD